MGPHTKEEGAEPPPISPGGSYSIQASLNPTTPLLITNHYAVRQYLLDAKSTFAVKIKTGPQKKGSRKFSLFASVERAIMLPVVVWRVLAQMLLTNMQGQRINGNTLYIGTSSTND